MVVAALIETADYKNFKMLCAYVNRVRHYLYLLRLERKEIPGVRYEPVNWFDRVTLTTYAKDPAKDGKDPVLKDMNVPDFPGYRKRGELSSNLAKPRRCCSPRESSRGQSCLISRSG